MGKKHGFKGTPVRPSGPNTMGRVFESRGLGTSARDQERFARCVGRNLETENPDMDRYFARLASDLLRPEQIDRTTEGKKRNVFLEGRKQPYDPQRKAAQTMLETRAAVRKAQEGALVYKDNKKKRPDDGVSPDNIPATVPAGSDEPSREKQTPLSVRHSSSTYDFSGKLPPKEIKKHGKIYRRR